MRLAIDKNNYPEVKQWINRAKDCIEDASILIDYGKITGPISKIYYACFYCAKALLLLYAIKHKKHATVVGNFGKIIVKKKRFPKKFGKFLHRMFNLRQKTDYSSSFSILSRRELIGVLSKTKIFMSYTENFIVKRMKQKL